MPIIQHSSYKPPFIFKFNHLATIFPSKTRKVEGVTYQRQRIDTPDDDFLDLDVASIGGENAVLVLHGLGGHTDRAYVKGMIKAFHGMGWDGLALNFRSCSGEPNRRLRFYHSGETGDLHHVIDYIKRHFHYNKVVLIGFSMGGNVAGKYLGEQGEKIDPLIYGSVLVSVPCDLAASSARLDGWSNTIYRKRFMRILHRGIRAKMALMPDRLNDDGFDAIKTFRQYDNRYTAPIHGFKDADDYYAQSGCKRFLPGIAVPTLMIEALDDPFLAPSCYPYEEARQNPHFFLETPKHGGHNSFVTFNGTGEYWHETRAKEFIGSLGSHTHC